MIGRFVKYRGGRWKIVDIYRTGDARGVWEVYVLEGVLSKAIIHLDWWEVEAPNEEFV